MSGSERDWNELVGTLYDAALDDTLWTPAIGGFMALVGSSQSMLFSPAVNPATSHPFLLNRHIHEDSWKRYTEYYWQHDIWSKRAIEEQLFSRGSFIRGEAMVSRDQLRQSEIYQDCLRTMDVEVLLSTILFDDSTPEWSPRTHLTLFRPVGVDDFSPEDEYWLKQFSPHLQRALRIRQQMLQQQEQQALREAALNHINQAMLLLDDQGRVLFANQLAESIFREGFGPLVVNHRLTAASPDDAARLKESITRVALNLGDTVRLEDRARKRHWVLTFSPLRRMHTGMPSARVLVLITAPERSLTDGLPLFAQTYRLTPAETRVMHGLLEQNSTQAIAELLSISMNTLRTHLKNLFSKTRTGNQKELVQFFLSHPGIGGGFKVT